MREVALTELSVDVVNLWMNRWLLLTAGTVADCNMMTVAWGSIGCMWSRPFAQIVVRPQRHTRKYIEQSDSFTLCAFPEKYRKDLQTLGTLSGRDGDKLAKTGLTLKASQRVAAPSYNEASFILECRKIYYQDMDPRGFVDKTIQDNYAAKDYHRIYFGEILSVYCE
ncbi:MAG: flavin reductase [Verrucomicrobia bacterium]|nr:flavin reductase [Verrucomicrobiota bacterium]MBU1734910.1 flavin reductase [Verrucomicrobiota bacterium]MBU1857704.1 flavin reductase [Verrucomicrobiota bacterium]